jgi:hypothetical protein
MQAVIIHMLESSIERLKIDLQPLEYMLKQNKEGMYITHNGKDSIIIYANVKYKAYIPKKYDSWKVNFKNWNGTDEFELDLEEEIYT